MNNMYDILNKMTLLEGKGSKPDFLDLDKDGNKKEPMKSAAKEKQVDEASTGDYSAKKARAGKDIGKPGKAFAQIASKAGKSYGSKERGEKVAGAVLAKLRGKNEGVETEGNAFTGKLKATPKGGKFKLGDKTFTDTSDIDEGWDEMMKSVRDRADSKVGDKIRGHKHDIEITPTGRRVTRRVDPEGYSVGADDDTEGTPVKRGRGRPKGAGKKLGAKGKTNVVKKRVKEQMPPGAMAGDEGEYGQEGDMAKDQIHTIVRNAQDLERILGNNENLPEWVQSKLAKIEGMMTAVSDYMQTQHEREGDEVELDEKAVSKKQQRFMGMVHAAQKGEKPASKEVAKVAKSMGKKDAEDFAATKHKGLPEKKKKDVEETTTSGAVATSTEAPKAKKGGFQFGKGVYEGAIKESFEKKLSAVLNEGMSINMSVGENGQKSLSVNATDEDAVHLADILKMAGLGGGNASGDTGCGCNTDPCSCDQMDEATDDLANAPDVEMADTDTLINKLSGGLNGKKTTGQTTTPVVNRDPARGSVGPKEMAESEEKKLMDLYKQYKV